MGDLLEGGRGRCTDALRRTVLAHKLREPRLDRIIAALQRIVIGIGNFRLVALVIKKVVAGNLGGQPGQFRLRLLSAQCIDGFAIIGHGHQSPSAA